MKKQRKRKSVRKARKWTSLEIILSTLLICIIAGVFFVLLFFSKLNTDRLGSALAGIAETGLKGERMLLDSLGNSILFVLLSSILVILFFTRGGTLKRWVSQRSELYFLKRRIFHATLNETVLQNLLEKAAEEYKEGKITKTTWNLKQRYYKTKIEQCKLEVDAAEAELKRKLALKIAIKKEEKKETVNESSSSLVSETAEDIAEIENSLKEEQPLAKEKNILEEKQSIAKAGNLLEENAPLTAWISSPTSEPIVTLTEIESALKVQEQAVAQPTLLKMNSVEESKEDNSISQAFAELERVLGEDKKESQKQQETEEPEGVISFRDLRDFLGDDANDGSGKNNDVEKEGAIVLDPLLQGLLLGQEKQ